MKTKQDFPSINERPPEGENLDGTKYRVLVVDDSMFVAKQLTQILSSDGYEIVATAQDGKEGVDKYKELCPNVDLVTMDITMPRMDGITALEQIIAFDKNAKVVMVSALGKEELVKRIRTVYDLLQSPDVDMETKGNAIRRVLQKIVYDSQTKSMEFYYYV